MTDAAAEPLFSHNRDFANDETNRSEDGEGNTEIDESALISPGVFVWGLTICAGVSGLLFGYEYYYPL